MCRGLCGKFHGEHNSENILKMANICQSYEQMYSGTVFLTHCVAAVVVVVVVVVEKHLLTCYTFLFILFSIKISCISKLSRPCSNNDSLSVLAQLLRGAGEFASITLPWGAVNQSVTVGGLLTSNQRRHADIVLVGSGGPARARLRSAPGFLHGRLRFVTIIPRPISDEYRMCVVCTKQFVRNVAEIAVTER